MMNLNNINEELKLVKSAFYERINHSFIRQFLDLPKLDEDKIFFLISMLNEKKMEKDQMNNYLFSALLVQSALDTHETISTEKASCNTSKKQRQLSVLAGDYYSSLYYFLLAENEDVRLIRFLASAIQEVNESKMNIYLPNNQSLIHSFEAIKIIESSVLQKVAECVHLPFWKKLISEFFFLKRLVFEKNLIVKDVNHSSRFINFLNEANRTKCVHLCDQYIQISKQNIFELCHRRGDLKEFLSKRIEEIFPLSSLFNDKVAEEG